MIIKEYIVRNKGRKNVEEEEIFNHPDKNYEIHVLTGFRSGVFVIRPEEGEEVPNDEMEGIAFDRLKLNDTPLNSLKGYFGHTLGAAGIIELIITMSMMENNVMLKSMGFDTLGLSKELNVLTQNCEKDINIALKTASGFGGGNASVLIKKAI